MAQIVPAAARLRRRWSRQPIGYRVLDRDRNLFRVYTRENVLETEIPAHFAVVGGIEAPDNGGYIVWGTESQDIAEDTISPSAAVTMRSPLAKLKAALSAVATQIIEAMPEMPPITLAPAPVDTTVFEDCVQSLRADLMALAKVDADQQGQALAAIMQRIEDARTAVVALAEFQANGQTETAAQFDTLSVSFSTLKSSLFAQADRLLDASQATITERAEETLSTLVALFEKVQSFEQAIGGQIAAESHALRNASTQSAALLVDRFDQLAADLRDAQAKQIEAQAARRRTQHKQLQSLRLIERFAEQLEHNDG